MIVCVGVGHHRGATKRPLASSVESVKTLSEVCRSSDLRGGAFGRNECGKGRPPSIVTRPTGPTSLEQSRVCAREVLRNVRRRQSLDPQIREHGVAVHELSGRQ